MRRFRVPAIVRWFFFKRTWRINDPNGVALTFDDGPTAELSDWILAELKKHDVKATFFCVGSNVVGCKEQYERILKDGHQIGNHTYRHEKGTQTSRAEYLNSIDETDQLVETNLFRPPYGRLPLSYGSKILSKHKIIMWTWLSYDYDKDVSLDEILRSAEKDIQAGDILVLHDNKKVAGRLKELLPEVIRIVKSKGLEFKLISA